MGPATPEEREDAILQVLDRHPEGIGFNQLQGETEMTRKTLHKYLETMQKSKKITIEKLGNKPNSELRITANFPEEFKKTIERNLAVTTSQHWSRYKTKIQRSNVFPHYLQQLASEYYEYMIHRLSDNSALYQFALNRLEEQLDKERDLLQKEFGDKALERVFKSCDELAFDLFTRANSAMNHAAMRKEYRTRDEISRDTVVTPQMHPEEPLDPEDLDLSEILQDSRIDLIKDKKKQEEFLKLLKEYNQLSARLTDIQTRLIFVSGMYPFKDTIPIKPTN
jgi:hypothetical protein